MVAQHEHASATVPPHSHPPSKRVGRSWAVMESPLKMGDLQGLCTVRKVLKHVHDATTDLQRSHVCTLPEWRGLVAINVSILKQPKDRSYHGLRAVVDKHGLGVIPMGWRLAFGTRGMCPSWVQ